MVREMIVTTLLFGGTVCAGDVSFHPEVGLEEEYSDNVIFSTDHQAISDFFTRIWITLPVVNRWDSGRLRFSYEPYIERYQDIDQLDNDGHSLLFVLDDIPDRRSELHFDLGFLRSQDQGTSSSILEDELFLTQPYERDRLSGSLSYSRQMGRRWGWNGALNGTDLTYTELYDTVVPDEGIEDRKEYGAVLGLDFPLSSQSTLGVLFRYRSSELEVSGSEDIQHLGLAWHGTVGRGGDFRVELGVLDRSGEFILLGQEEPESISQQEIFGGVELTRNMRKSRLRLLARRQPSSGGATSSPSTDDLISVSFSGDPSTSRSWDWVVSARYASRDPLDPSIEEQDVVGAGCEIEWRPMKFTGYLLGLDYVNQRSGFAIADRSVSRAWVGFVWYPRGPEGQEE